MIAKLISPILKTLFPPVCNVCGKKLFDHESAICDGCMSGLPVTNNWHIAHNLIYDRLREEAEIVAAVTLFHYKAGDPYTNLILNAKFRNQRSLAHELGCVMGRYIRSCKAVEGVDYLVAVPLHKSRLRWRGYNQSDYIAEGLSEVLGIPVLKGAVVRHKKSEMQSRMKGRSKRKENVKGIFGVTDKEKLEGKRILLVDDVITTGATMASCAKAIKKAVPTIEIVATALSSTE